MGRYKAVLCYKGTHFKGFQIQPKQRTVEGELLTAIKKIYNNIDKLVGSGRTDTGVHAQNQIIHFDSKEKIALKKSCHSLNAVLPNDIRIQTVEKVDNTFHACLSAKKRQYCYLFSNQRIPIYMQDYIMPVPFKPDLSIVKKLEPVFLGEHDFKVFRNTGSTENHTVRTLYEFTLKKKIFNGFYNQHDAFKYYELTISANGFLYKMVRNIVGALFEVMKDKASYNDLKEYFLGKSSSFRYTVAQAKGLCLMNVIY